jgi:hypothetical protein
LGYIAKHHLKNKQTKQKQGLAEWLQEPWVQSLALQQNKTKQKTLGAQLFF